MLALICLSRKKISVTTSVTLMTGVLLTAGVQPNANTHPPNPPPLSLSLSLSTNAEIIKYIPHVGNVQLLRK